MFMIGDGLVVLVPFPQVEPQFQGKIRPAIVVRSLPGGHDDWLICMVSSRVIQSLQGFDEVISNEDADFTSSGLKVRSVIRIARLAVCHGSALLGGIGRIDDERLQRVRNRLSEWLLSGRGVA
jgi:mRNA interferase MazF